MRRSCRKNSPSKLFISFSLPEKTVPPENQRVMIMQKVMTRRRKIVSVSTAEVLINARNTQ